MRFDDTDLPGLRLATLDARRDERGSFTRLYCSREMQAAGIARPVVQINHSVTTQRGTVRGLHFQHAPATETKFIRCVRGAVWDVAVDLRAGSPTFMQWRAFELSAENQRMVVIPDGMAHGFQALTDDAELIYFHTNFYTPENEGGFNVLDLRLSISWPLLITQQSERDRGLPFVPAEFRGLTL